jgi:ADP-heptose:LPS heptosyltransferase
VYKNLIASPKLAYAVSMKFLVIRFSSIGDVAQALSIPTKIAEKFSTHESVPAIDFVVRDDIAEIVQGHPHIHRVWTLSKKTGFQGLWKLIQELKEQQYTHIYDAHNSLRSLIICWFLRFPLSPHRLFSNPEIVRKPRKVLKRILLFKFRKNTYRLPRSGQRDLLEALSDWHISEELPPTPQMMVHPDSLVSFKQKIKSVTADPFLAIAPSAAYELKRWPVAFFIEVIKAFPEKKFILLGGPSDQFIEEIYRACPDNSLNLSGQLTLSESAAAVFYSQGLLANDTGLLHFAEQLGQRAIALMGPAPFGFPSRPTTKILERELPCRPCSKHGQGPCVNTEYQKCMRDIKPREVIQEIQSWLC